MLQLYTQFLQINFLIKTLLTLNINKVYYITSFTTQKLTTDKSIIHNNQHIPNRRAIVIMETRHSCRAPLLYFLNKLIKNQNFNVILTIALQNVQFFSLPSVCIFFFTTVAAFYSVHLFYLAFVLVSESACFTLLHKFIFISGSGLPLQSKFTAFIDFMCQVNLHRILSNKE